MYTPPPRSRLPSGGNNSVRVSVTRSPGPRHLRGNSGASLCPLSCSPWPPKWAWHRQCFCKGRGAYSHLGGYGRQGSTHKDAVNTQGWDEHTRRVWTHVAGVKTRRRCKQTRQVWTYYVHDLGRWSIQEVLLSLDIRGDLIKPYYQFMSARVSRVIKQMARAPYRYLTCFPPPWCAQVHRWDNGSSELKNSTYFKAIATSNNFVPYE